MSTYTEADTYQATITAAVHMGRLHSAGARAFAYDKENRLVTATVTATSTTVTLGYDPTGRLATQVTTVGAGSPVTTQFLYGGSQLAAEYDGSGNLLRRYVYGPGSDEPLVWYEGALGTTDRRWLHTDERGSVIAQSNNAGAVTQIYAYGPYGEPQDNWGAGSRFRYTGQIAIPEAQLYYYKARVYDPLPGRFLQADPIGYGGGGNLYAYVGGDPMDLVDPTGHCPDRVCEMTVVGHRLPAEDNILPAEGNTALTSQALNMGVTTGLGAEAGFAAGGSVQASATWMNFGSYLTGQKGGAFQSYGGTLTQGIDDTKNPDFVLGASAGPNIGFVFTNARNSAEFTGINAKQSNYNLILFNLTYSKDQNTGFWATSLTFKGIGLSTSNYSTTTCEFHGKLGC